QDRDTKLARWLAYQRRRAIQGALGRTRRAFLDQFFEGQPARDHSRTWDQRWQAMFRALEEFERRYGHSRVPTNWPEAPGLPRWLARQRHLRRTQRLSPDRERAMTLLGIEWGSGGRGLDGVDERWSR